MPIFEPRTKEEIRTSMMARHVATSVLTDVSEGGTAHSALGSVAEEIEYAEERIKGIRDSFWFEGAQGSDLDERMRDLPNGGPRRIQASPASGPAMRLVRTDTTSALLIPEGTTYAQEDVIYVQTEDVTIPAGETSYPPASDPTAQPVSVVCSISGTDGDAAIGAINRIVSGPAGLTSASNTEPLFGIARETDEQYKLRGRAYMSSLARCQPGSLTYLALTFQSTNQARVQHASLLEDPVVPGYSLLVVDDGTGLAGLTKAGATSSGTVPTNGQTVLYHEQPGVEPISTISINGVPQVFTAGVVPSWTSVEERGLLYPTADLPLSAGDTWSISGYDVYTGFIRELQAVIEGDPANISREPGWRAAGTRVKVVPPTPQDQDFVVNVIAELGYGLEDVEQTVKEEIIAFLRALGPGETLFLSQLLCALVALDGVKNASFETPTGDVSPSSLRHSLRTNTSRITVQ